jgi:hypothetical protein
VTAVASCIIPDMKAFDIFSPCCLRESSLLMPKSIDRQGTFR